MLRCWPRASSCCLLLMIPAPCWLPIVAATCRRGSPPPANRGGTGTPALLLEPPRLGVATGAPAGFASVGPTALAAVVVAAVAPLSLRKHDPSCSPARGQNAGCVWVPYVCRGCLVVGHHGANKGWGFAETTPNDFWEDARHWRTLFHTWILNFHFNNNCDADELYSDWLAEVTYDLCH